MKTDGDQKMKRKKKYLMEQIVPSKCFEFILWKMKNNLKILVVISVCYYLIFYTYRQGQH